MNFNIENYTLSRGSRKPNLLKVKDSKIYKRKNYNTRKYFINSNNIYDFTQL